MYNISYTSSNYTYMFFHEWDWHLIIRLLREIIRIKPSGMVGVGGCKPWWGISFGKM
jgi:hypothetical protein